MKISFNLQNAGTGFSKANGYGYATQMVMDSLDACNIAWDVNDATADVGFVFDQPHHAFFYPGQYRIIFHPWESTRLRVDQPKDWLEQLNSCDEVWTPSDLIAGWYRDYMGIKPPVYVYEHGVDGSVWASKKRNFEMGSEPFKFLHVGGEAVRKGLKEAMQALRMAFPKSADVQLTSKIISASTTMWLPRIRTIAHSMPLNELVGLYHDHHAFVYPSWGEGFGLTPLQAMSTGMPTITVPQWAPYRDFLDPNLNIGSELTQSPWPLLHPGQMLKPSLEDTIEAMRYAYNNYEKVETESRAKVQDLLKHYDWDRLTKQAFEALEKRL